MADFVNNGHHVNRGSEFESELLIHADALMSFAISITHCKATSEDLYQTTFIKASLNQKRFKPGSSLRAWLFTILRNTYLSQLRKSKWEWPMDYEMVESFEAPREDLEWEEREELTKRFLHTLPLLANLPKEQRDAIIAIHYLGYKYEKSAEMLGINIGTVKSRVSRGMSEVRRMMMTESMGPFDLSSWSKATDGVLENHHYFPIAKAYEEIYGSMVKNSKSVNVLKQDRRRNHD